MSQIENLKDKIVVGNAADQGQEDGRRGWFIGHFIDPREGLRFSEEVEFKWAIHPAGESKPDNGVNLTATTISILISGKFIINFPDQDYSLTLVRSGDYVLFAPGVLHNWLAAEDTVILNMRWPSLAGDQKTSLEK
jgi:hypothetical protein